MKLAIRIFIGVILISLSAFVKFDLPATEIPISGQSFALFVIAWWLGFPGATLCIASYLALGTLGVPIFAGGTSGVEKWSGGTAGFLASFLVCATAIGIMKSHLPIRNRWFHPFVNYLIATMVLLGLGNAWLVMKFGLEKGLSYGFWPIWPGAIIKLILATVLTAMATIIFPKNEKTADEQLKPGES